MHVDDIWIKISWVISRLITLLLARCAIFTCLRGLYWPNGSSYQVGLKKHLIEHGKSYRTVYNNIKFESFISLKISVKSGDAADGFFGKGQKSKLISGRQLVNGQRQKRCFRHSPRDKKWTRGRLSEADQASSFLVAADGIVNQRRQPLFDRERVAAPKK